MATAELLIPQYVGSMSRGESSIANFTEKQYGNGLQELQDSYVLGQKAKGSFNELASVWEECMNPNWDGYGALPVSIDSVAFAFRLLQALPLTTPAPSIAAEPDGHINLEWYVSPRHTLSVSVGSEGQLHFSALIGGGTQYGSEPFYGEMPQSIRDLIYRISVA